GWAEYVAVGAESVCVVPDDIDIELAATLPVAGITALRILEWGGNLLGRRVLITGAAGGVGGFATSMAIHAGADVTAVISQGRGDLPHSPNIDVVAKIEEAEGRFDLIMESVGGDSLATAMRKVAPNGTVVTFGNSSQVET